MNTPLKDFVLGSAANYPQDPAEMLTRLFMTFSLEEIHQHFYELLNHFLTSDEIPNQTGSQRNDKILFCEVMYFASQAMRNAIEDLRLAKHIKAGK